MATLHEVSSAKIGDSFISVGPVIVSKQLAPFTAKNGKLYSTVFLKNGASDMGLGLWDGAAGWKLPIGTEIVLRGKFVKSAYKGGSLDCSELSKPEGAREFEKDEIQAPAERASVRACIDAGLRGADYVERKGKPELASAAFAFAAQALLDGHKLE